MIGSSSGQTAFEFVFWSDLLLRVQALERGYKDLLKTASVTQESVDSIRADLEAIEKKIQKNQDLNSQRFYEIQERMSNISDRA